MAQSQSRIALGGVVLFILLAGCLSGTPVGQSQSPTSTPLDETATPPTDDGPSPSPTPSTPAATAHCVDGVSFYGLDSPGETAWAPDRIAIGYTVPANASVFFVAFEEGNVIGTTHVTTRDLEHGVTADGDGIPLDRPASGSHMIRVGAYTDTNDNGEFDFGTDQPCRTNGQPVEAGPRRINFSTFRDEPDSLTPTSTPPAEDVVAYEELPPDAQQEFTAALEQNGIEKCEITLLDIEQSLIRYQGAYYTYAVQSGPKTTPTDGCDTDLLTVEKVEKIS